MFSTVVKQQALKRSRGRCECQQLDHLHFDRCAVQVNLDSAFQQVTRQKITGKAGSLHGCEVLCVSCHRLNVAYGRSAPAA